MFNCLDFATVTQGIEKAGLHVLLTLIILVHIMLTFAKFCHMMVLGLEYHTCIPVL